MSSKPILIIFLTLLTLAVFTPLSFAAEKTETAPKQLDPRSLALKYYLKNQNSPLAEYADSFVKAADKNGLDWKLVPAISGAESNFGKKIPGKNSPVSSFNAWGWGVHSRGTLYFPSWQQGIETVNKGLKEKYVNRGLTTPESMNINYSVNPLWADMVNYFIADIDEYSVAFWTKFGHQIDTYNQNQWNQYLTTVVQPVMHPMLLSDNGFGINLSFGEDQQSFGAIR